MAKAPVDSSKDLKHRISSEGVRWLAGELAAVRPRFARKRFVESALDGLEGLELKGRVDHVASALELVMPAEFAESAAILQRAVDSPDFDGWMVYPVNEYIARAGIDDPRAALPLLARTTGRWTAEYAIRPFIERHFEITYALLEEWVTDPDHHVRRLVSEGTRPRLPWGKRLRALVEDPRPSIRLLGRLVDDPSEYVRRSIANHLNDIAKDHPELALETAEGWLGSGESPPGHRLAIVRHGLRTLIKQGNPPALTLLGFDPEAAIDVVSFDASPMDVTIGEQATIAVELSGPARPTPAMVDYLVHFQGANGPRNPKVFKWTVRTLDPGVTLSLTRRHRFQHASVRRLHPGPHLIEIQINGLIRAATTINLQDG